jgi:membrane protease YdiL (CAAX protease family)
MPSATSVPVVRAACRPWGFWTTLGWFVLAAIACFTAMAVSFSVPMSAAALENFATIVGVFTATLVLAFAARRAGWRAADYFAFARPRWRDILVAFSWLVAFWLLLPVVTALFPSADQSEVVTNEYRGAMGSATELAMYWIAAVVSAPIAEEIVFRGFLFRGWAASRLGTAGALMLSSLVFALIHMQYNWQGMAMVFGLGFLFGLMRWRFGTIVVPILMHATWNLTVCITLMLSV